MIQGLGPATFPPGRTKDVPHSPFDRTWKLSCRSIPCLAPTAECQARPTGSPGRAESTDLWSKSRDVAGLSGYGSAVIAITVVLSDLDAVTQQAGETAALLAETSLAEISAGWRFLGFDVATIALLSGLLNCGYTYGELRMARRTWGRGLNRFHLFSDYASANRCRRFTEERARRDGPFYVCGLRLVSPAGPSVLGLR